MTDPDKVRMIDLVLAEDDFLEVEIQDRPVVSETTRMVYVHLNAQSILRISVDASRLKVVVGALNVST